ncbi:unnamed protein product [Prunus armeniaca]
MKFVSQNQFEFKQPNACHSQNKEQTEQENHFAFCIHALLIKLNSYREPQVLSNAWVIIHISHMGLLSKHHSRPSFALFDLLAHTPKPWTKLDPPNFLYFVLCFLFPSAKLIFHDAKLNFLPQKTDTKSANFVFFSSAPCRQCEERRI